ncbi:hypothetical protein OG897_20245 [Streptomyces sp. NBC_00237]|uniref:hypothetical protein n=1 Tax=Streptomyces sp. NBC_00237 TaxID=2975687 RepID=UPI0022541EEB|nr:hypothetical protein [Streptomyces sp. NBC_00237]MCX5203777.1 hypothetical protein [Streptomyces sp. NBC_00237]
MGVFAMFRRKSKDTAEASTEEEQTGTPTADSPEVTAAAGNPADVKAGSEAPEGASAEVTDDATKAVPEAADAVADAPDAEGLEIPKQQSADEAADNEVGESARK